MSLDRVSERKSVVVARAAPEIERVSGSGRFFSWWGENADARIWRISLDSWPCGAAEELRSRLGRMLPDGCQVLATSFRCRDLEQGGSRRGQCVCGGARRARAVALVDFGLVCRTAPGGRVSNLAEWLRTADVVPCAWSASTCWKDGSCVQSRCVGESVWDCQERMLGEDVAFTVGNRLVEREFECIEVVSGG
jgi:hypothetical protein